MAGALPAARPHAAVPEETLPLLEEPRHEESWAAWAQIRRLGLAPARLRGGMVVPDFLLHSRGDRARWRYGPRAGPPRRA